MASYDQTVNPIQSVGGTTVPPPSSYEYQLSDISSPDAGRTEDGLMHKMMIGQKVHLNLKWQNLTDAEAATVLTAFNQEYLSIKYYDVKSAGFLTKTFYVGDRSAPAYNRTVGVWSGVSFNVIER